MRSPSQHLPPPLPCASLRSTAMKPLTILLALAATAGADDLIPQALPRDRYSETIGKSPFVLETKVAEPEAPGKNIFLNLYLRGVGTADGKDAVLIQRIGEERPMRFLGSEPGPEEFSVKSVRIGNNFRETKVVLQKGTETCEIGFKEDTINAPPPAPNNRGPALPGQMQRNGATMPPQMPAVRVTQPGAPVQTVPRPGVMPMPQPTTPQPVNVPQIPGTPQTRVRTRPINQ